MPSVMIYIRQADYDKWTAIQDKPAFMHKVLNGEEKKPVESTVQDQERKLNEKLEPKEPTKPAIVLNKSLERQEGKFCPNGHPIPEGKSKCLGKGCKYA